MQAWVPEGGNEYFSIGRIRGPLPFKIGQGVTFSIWYCRPFTLTNLLWALPGPFSLYAVTRCGFVLLAVYLLGSAEHLHTTGLDY